MPKAATAAKPTTQPICGPMACVTQVNDWPQEGLCSITIVVGDRYQSDYVVTDGLKAGETVVVEGIQKIRAGSTVIPSKAQSAESAPQQ